MRRQLHGGFATSSDKQRLETFIRQRVCLTLYANDDITMTELVADLKDNLFATVLANDQHVLRHMLPDRNNILIRL